MSPGTLNGFSPVSTTASGSCRETGAGPVPTGQGADVAPHRPGPVPAARTRQDHGVALGFDEVIAFVGRRPHLRLLAIDGLPLAGKTTLADRLAAAIGGACVFLDDFIKPEREWRWRDRPSFPFDFIRYDEFAGAVRGLSTDGACRYRPWDYRTGERVDFDCVVRLDGPVIVEGVSALHPDLAPLYDLRVWVESDAATVLDAARARGVGSWAREWEVMFVPSVALYLRTDPKGRADVLAAGRGASGAGCSPSAGAREG